MTFTKYVSIGNDFVLIRDSANLDFPSLAEKLCSRHFGIGADGLLVFRMDGDGVVLRMFNPDGTEDFCGNGLRCAALEARTVGWLDDVVPIRHMGRDTTASFSIGGWVDVQIPGASFAADDVPLAEGVGEVFDRDVDIAGDKLRISSLTTGSTHTVIFMERPPEDDLFQRASRAMENYVWFPQRTSVIWAWHEKHNRLRIRIWERGAGETQGCGTGSAAVATCLFRKNPNLVAAEVVNPGGECAVAIGPGGTLVVSAKAQAVYSGDALLESEKLVASKSLSSTP